MSKFTDSKFMSHCNQKLWLRMIVCLGPGILLTKLFDQAAMSTQQTISIYIFYAGAVVFGAWSYSLRRLKSSVDDAETEMQVTNSSKQEEYSMADLIALCAGNSEMAIRLVETESKITSGISLSEAIRRAYVRKTMGF